MAETPPRRPTLDPASGAIRTAVRSALTAVSETQRTRPRSSVVPVPEPAMPGLIIAVSGGADSMALLHACAFLHRRGEVRARAVTVDHGLQDGSAEVARRVATTAESWGMPAETVVVRIEAGDEGLEAAARRARYAALEQLRADTDADWILTAHTLSDQAETVLLGLMRGSGTRSLAGMSPRTGRMLRPLLRLDRATTEASCRAQGIEVWNDPMNEDPAFSRVRARRLLADFEAELGQPITDNLARTADLCRADADFLDGRAAAVTAEIGTGPTLPLADLAALEEAILGRVLRTWLLGCGVPAQNLGAVRVGELSALIRGRSRGRLSLPGDNEVVVGHGRVTFQRAATAR